MWWIRRCLSVRDRRPEHLPASGRLARRSRPLDRPATARGGREFRALLAASARRADRSSAAAYRHGSAGQRAREHSVFRQRSRFEARQRRTAVQTPHPRRPPPHHVLDGVFPAGRRRVARVAARPRRGVPVRIVVPGESDVALVQHASRYLYTRCWPAASASTNGKPHAAQQGHDRR